MAKHIVSHPRALQASFQYEAKALANMHGLKTVWGKRPSINLRAKVLNLPHVPFVDDPEKLQKLKAKFRRWVAHECGGHARYSDPDLSERFIDELDEEPQLWELFMDIEDPRVDKLYSGDYLGAKMALDDGLKAMMEDKEIRDGSNSPFDALSCFVHYFGRIFHTGQSYLMGMFDGARKQLVDFLEESGVERLEALLSSSFPSLTNSEDALLMAKQVLELVEDIAQEQEEKNSSNDESEEQEQNEDDDTESNSASDPSEDSDNSEETTDDDESDNGADNSSDESEEGEGNAKASARQILDSDSEGDTATEAARAFEQAVEDAVESSDSPSDYPGSSQGSPALGSDGDKTVSMSNEARYYELQDQLEGTVADLRNQVRNMILAMTRARRIPTTSGPRLKQKNLWKVALGNLSVYERKIKTPLPKSAVSLLIDLSDSMTWTPHVRIIMAQQVVAALSEVLHAINTPFEVLGFGGYNYHPAGLIEIKPFNQAYIMSRGYIGGMNGSAGGGTPLAEGMLEAGLRLAAREEERKLLFVITDGDPNDRASAQDMSERLTCSGITTVGVGIDSNSGHDLFDRWGVVHSSKELGSEILNALYETLTGQAIRAA